MIGVEWGITGFRAFRFSPDGGIRDRRTSPRGIQRVQDGRFGDALREEVGPWLAGGERHVLLCGGIGGRQGWVETGYIACPAGPAELASSLTPIGFDWAEVRIVPGLTSADGEGALDLMRGPETAILGALGPTDSGHACVPGPHNAWAKIVEGRIVMFSAHMTAEVFAALRTATSLARNPREGGAGDASAFEAGLSRSGTPGGVLRHLAGMRALMLTGRLTDAGASSYLSGLLIGHEARAALAGVPAGTAIHLIGAPEAITAHARAIGAAGGLAAPLDGEATARGLARIGVVAKWDTPV